MSQEIEKEINAILNEFHDMPTTLVNELVKYVLSKSHKEENDFYCHDKLVSNACEDFEFKKCAKQCEACIYENID